MVGTPYYVSATAGAITSSAPALARLVGIAPTTSSLILNANTLTIPVPVSQGGTGKTTLTAYGVLLGGTTTTAAVQPLTPAAAGQLLKSGGTGAVAAWTDDPSVATLTLSTPLAVASGGTGLDSLTSASVIVGAGTSDVTFVAPGTSGNVLTSNGSIWSSSAVAAVVTDLGICEGRLTLTSGTPVTTADVTGATSVFFAPYAGNRIALYDGSSDWNVRTFTEITIAVGTIDAGKPYDLFAYDNSGTVTFDAPLAWTNDTSRATALTPQNGVLVKTGATTRRYIGTLYTTATTTTEDSYAKRFLWNYYNRVTRPMRVLEATSSWVYTTATLRQARGSAANQLDFVCGMNETPVSAMIAATYANTSAGVNVLVSLGLDSTSATATGVVFNAAAGAAGSPHVPVASLVTFPGVGRHYVVWLEYSTATGTTTWYSASALRSSGIQGWIEG